MSEAILRDAAPASDRGGVDEPAPAHVHDASAELGDFTTTPHVLWISGLAVGLGLVSALLAKGLLALIALATNVFFFLRWSTAPAAPADSPFGPWLALVPDPRKFAAMASPRRSRRS